MLIQSACAETVGKDFENSPLFGLSSGDSRLQLAALETLDKQWSDNYTPAMLEYISLAQITFLRERAHNILTIRSGQNFGYDLNAWFGWSWSQNLEMPRYYAEFKARLYSQIDSRFASYFSSSKPADIRLDEIRWGGVRQNGIPPLRSPDMISAREAHYLEDDNIVFGLAVNGDVRAYPKRILAWHEMFIDEVGGVDVTGVYCTLCGSMILYESTDADTFT